MQLVTDRVWMLNPAKEDTIYDPAKVKRFHGSRTPADRRFISRSPATPWDNIPGAPGIGEKGAVDLLTTVRLA